MGILATLLLLACSGPDDPRARIAAGLPPASAAVTRDAAERALLLGRVPVACNLIRTRLTAEADDVDWRLFLVVGARARTQTCLADADGDALSAWAAERTEWAGARAEWAAARGDLSGAVALLGPAGNDGARLRVALATGDGDRAATAAEGALVEEPRDVLACHTLGRAALERGDAAWAIELSECGGIGHEAPELRRLRAEALDRAGEVEAAAAAWREAGASVHLAALLYQEGEDAARWAEAAELLRSSDAPPALLHRGWLALATGEAPVLDGLDEGVPARVLRALARGDASEIGELSGTAPAIARARIAATHADRVAMEKALDEALAGSPASEPVHRARIALRLAAGGDVSVALADWAAQDPDHVAAVGRRGDRDLPWRALVPERWEDLAERHPDPRMRADAPSGSDGVGAEIRAARGRPTAAEREDALAAIASKVPGLDGMVRERYLAAVEAPRSP